ncbi:MAG: outer membrane lipoprotein carrier protein LolA [Candidatus Cloacimonadales bacterium]
MATLKSKILLLILLLPLLVMANEAKAEEFLRQISEQYDQISTFQADFIQSNSWTNMDQKLESSGKIYYDADNLILKYTEPEEQVMKIYQNEISIYQAANNRLMISENKEISLQPLDIIRQYWEISDIHLIEIPEGYSLKLQYPNGKVEANIRDWMIYDIIIEDSSGNRVGYHFQNIEINQKLAADIFELPVDENSEIIDLRK